jgi:hypothetical protein
VQDRAELAIELDRRRLSVDHSDLVG